MSIKKEYIYAAIIATIVLLVSNISFIVPSVTKNDSLNFLGMRSISSPDVYTNVSMIEQARQGRTLFENQYTSEPQIPSLFRPSYLFIGQVARIVKISAMDAYQVFRIIFSVVFCFVLYKFLSLFFDTPGKRLIAYTITLTASGLGFLFAKWFPYSIDLWVPEAFTFLSFSDAPHFMLSFTLLLTGFYFFIKYLKTGHTPLLLLTFASFMFLSFEHPYDIFVVVPVIFITLLWNKTPFVKSFIIACLSGIGIAYQILEIYINPILKAWQLQNRQASPPFVNYLIGFGLLLVFGLFGMQVFLNEQKKEQKFIISWLAVTALLLYIPINFQRRFVEGLEIPLAIVATTGIFKLIDCYKSKRKNKSGVILAVAITILSLSSFYSIYKDFKAYAADSKDSPYYFIKNENLKGIVWLGQNTTFNDVILCNFHFGNIIPGIIARKVYLGHDIQTIDVNTKGRNAYLFFLGKDDSWALNFLKENHITYIFIGVDDNANLYRLRPDEKSYLTKVYDANGVYIYRIKD